MPQSLSLCFCSNCFLAGEARESCESTFSITDWRAWKIPLTRQCKAPWLMVLDSPGTDLCSFSYSFYTDLRLLNVVLSQLFFLWEAEKQRESPFPGPVPQMSVNSCGAETGDSTQVSHVGGRNPAASVITTACWGQQEPGSRSQGPWLSTDTLLWDTAIHPNWLLNCWAKRPHWASVSSSLKQQWHLLSGGKEAVRKQEGWTLCQEKAWVPPSSPHLPCNSPTGLLPTSPWATERTQA